MKHTPGPWHVGSRIQGLLRCQVLDENGAIIASAQFNPKRRPDSTRQMPYNAALIAAAPDLLDACKAALVRIEKLNIGTEELGEDPTITQLKAMIAKAEGE